jgi:hypothetical protein
VKKLRLIILQSLLLIIVTTATVQAQTSAVPMTASAPTLWTANELIEPADLAKTVNTGDDKAPVILNIGAVEDIKDAKHIGPVSNADNLAKLRTTVVALPKSTPMVIYCGCCPFAKCPNIRPAYLELKKLGFTDIKVLDLPTNLHTNWIAKGFPLAAK